MLPAALLHVHTCACRNQRRRWRPLLTLAAPGGATTSLANLKKSQPAPPVKGGELRAFCD